MALGAATQCTVLIHELATKGQVDEKQLAACLDPLFVLNPDSVADIYPDPVHFSNGINTLQQVFESQGLKQNAEAARYLLGVMVLQKKFLKYSEMQNTIGKRLEYIGDSRRDGSLQPLSDQEFAEISRVYQDTLSNLTYRIHVGGNPDYLRQPEVANRIRALLLAAIRSSVLWHQLGGRRWHLFLQKKRIRETLIGIRRKLISVNSFDAAAGGSESDSDQGNSSS